MKFNKCIRCGCFFTTDDEVCPNCKHKDEVDKISLKNFIANNDIPENVESLAFHSGVNIKNINRYLETKEFSQLKKTFNSINTDYNNPSIKL